MFSKKFLKFMQIWQNEFGIDRTFENKECVNKDNQPLPWYTYPAIEYLDQFDYSAKKIFEFGCGNSTIYWNLRAKKVISIEDKIRWFAIWQERLKSVNPDIRLRQNGEDYEQAILEEKEKYDVIVIDGIRRAECASLSIEALNSGGIIILDDSDRVNQNADYQKAVAILKGVGLLQIDFFGFCPMNVYPKATSLFLSADFNFPLRGKFQPANGIGNLWSLPRKQRKELYRFNKA